MLAMRLTLRIENHRTLPDGGPTVFTVSGQRGFDIGRGQYQDWTLPDESLIISGRHCEIRPQGDAYFLNDVSRNGTFVNGADMRVQSPHRLKSGDQLSIGPYIISVTVDGAAQPESDAPSVVARPVSYSEIWDLDGEVAPPINRKDLEPRRPIAPSHGDWIERPADIEPLSTPQQPRGPAPPEQEFDWASASEPSGPPSRAPIFTPLAVPEARRGAEPPLAAASGPETPDPDTSWAPVAPPAEPAPSIPPPTPTPRRSVSHGASAPWAPERENAPALDAAAQHAAPPVALAGGTAMPRGVDDFSGFLSSLSQASGVPIAVLEQSSATELGEKFGQLLRLFVEETRQLLEARSAAKRMTRSATQTVIQPRDNNPLKFSPTTDEALRILFGPPRPTYLDARGAFAQAFLDLKTHQVRSYAAMQQAVRLLGEDLDPVEIDKSVSEDGGLAKLVGSRKGRLWDAYVSRWDTKNRRSDDRLVDAFMRYYADCYDRSNAGK